MSATSAPVNVNPARAAESNVGWILGIEGTFHAIALLFVGLRVYTRLFQVRSFGFDDGLIVISALCAFFGGMVPYIISAFYALGRHADTVSKADYAMYMKMTFIQAVVCTIGSLAFLKLSVGAALLRLSSLEWYRRIIWGFICFVLVYTLISWIEWLLVCTPLDGFWDKSIQASCLPVYVHKGFALFNTASNILTDIVFATLPIPVIWQLQMKKKIRLYLIGILSLGYFAVLLGIVKTVAQNVFRGDPDQSFYNWIQFWGFLQINVGIIAACAPTLRRVFSRILGLRGTCEQSDSKYRTPGSGSSYVKHRYATRKSQNMGFTSRGNRGGGWIKSQSQTDEFELTTTAAGRPGYDNNNSNGVDDENFIPDMHDGPGKHEVIAVGGADAISRTGSAEEIIPKGGGRADESSSTGGRAHRLHPKNGIVRTTIVTVS